MPRIQAGGPAVGRRRLAAGLVGEDHRAGAVRGRARLEEADRLPHHRGLLHLLDGDVLDLQVGVRVLQGVEPVLDRHLPPDVLGGAAALDVGPDERGEGAAGAERGALAAAEGELGVALGLLLEGDGQHRLVLARLHVGGGDDGRWCRRPSRRCGPGTSACPPRRGRRRGRARASSRPRRGRGPCRGRRRRCRPSSCWASSRARNTASRTRPPSETSRRRDLWCVWPTPTTAVGITLRPPGCR